jgi:hypothetical protein
MATLHELDTVYGVEDVYDMLEVLSVDAHNRHALSHEE